MIHPEVPWYTMLSQPLELDTYCTTVPEGITLSTDPVSAGAERKFIEFFSVAATEDEAAGAAAAAAVVPAAGTAEF